NGVEYKIAAAIRLDDLVLDAVHGLRLARTVRQDDAAVLQAAGRRAPARIDAYDVVEVDQIAVGHHRRAALGAVRAGLHAAHGAAADVLVRARRLAGRR